MDNFKKDGFVKIDGFFDQHKVTRILEEAKGVFIRQMKKHNIDVPDPADDTRFLGAMEQLFKKDIDAFIYCGKQAQHLISLTRLAVSDNITDLLVSKGLSSPVICTRPVLFFNHPRLAKKDVYHTVFPHQDWRSMQGSLDSVVIWVPLMDINKSNGALRILPGSHKLGLLADEMEDGFGKVDMTDEMKNNMIDVEVKAGDALIFSSFLIHESGLISEDRIRWSCHFRYNNLDEETFISRRYFHPYIYRPDPKLYTTNFPTEDQLNAVFDEK